MIRFTMRQFLKTTCFGFLAIGLTACATTVNPYQNEENLASSYLKGSYAASQKEYDFAASAFDVAASAAPTDAQIINKAFFYNLASGKTAQASVHAEKLLRPEFKKETADDGPTTALALPLLTLAAEKFKNGELEEAEALLTSSDISRFSRSMAFMLYAWVAYEKEGAEAGLAVLDDNSPDLYRGFVPFHKALMYDLAGRDEEAELHYQAAIATYATNSTIFAYANFLERQSKRDASKREATIEFYRNLAGDAGTLRRFGRLGLARMGQPLEGETPNSLKRMRRSVGRPVEDAKDGAAMVFYNFAWAAYEQAMSEQSAASKAGFNNYRPVLNTPLSFSQLTVSLDPSLDSANYLIGAVLSTHNRDAAALNAYSKVGFYNPFYEYARMDMADAYIALGKNDEAIELLSTFIENDGLAPDAGIKLADLLSRQERHAEADEVFTWAIDVAEAIMTEQSQDANLWRYYFARGATRYEAGNWESAEADLQKAIELSPDQPYVLNFLGYSWAERGVNLDEAFAMIEKALELMPNSGSITDSLGWAHYQRGDYDQAIKYLERAVSLESGDPVITDHLGDAYWKAGRKNEARYEWRRALAFEPEAKLKVALEEKLSSGLQVAEIDVDASPAQ